MTEPLAPAAVQVPPNPDATLEKGLLNVYRQMLSSLFLATLLLIIMLTGVLLVFDGTYFFHNGDGVKEPSIFLFVTLSGALGAFFSALMRLYKFEDLPKALMDGTLKSLGNRYLIMYSLVPPLVGAIGATVLYVGFAAGLFQGDLFPKFACTPIGKICAGFGSLIEHFGPASAQDDAKALVWGFLAGFSERFLPDALGGIAKSEKK